MKKLLILTVFLASIPFVNAQETDSAFEEEDVEMIPVNDATVMHDVPDLMDMFVKTIPEFPENRAVPDTFWRTALSSYITNDSHPYATVMLQNDTAVSLILFLPQIPAWDTPTCWQWDATSKSYFPGKDSELKVSVITTLDPLAEVNRGDAWIWNASRSGESTYADDCTVTRQTYKGIPCEDQITMLFEHPQWTPDKGFFAWHTMYYDAYMGPTPRMFFCRVPHGSAADVRTFSERYDEGWLIEFRRLKTTRNTDDLPILFERPHFLQIQISEPGKKSWFSHIFALPSPELPEFMPPIDTDSSL